jgi:hypothetical protein
VGTLHPQKLAITSPTSGGRSVGIFRWRTQTMVLVFKILFPSHTHKKIKNLKTNI